MTWGFDSTPALSSNDSIFVNITLVVSQLRSSNFEVVEIPFYRPYFIHVNQNPFLYLLNIPQDIPFIFDARSIFIY